MNKCTFLGRLNKQITTLFKNEQDEAPFINFYLDVESFRKGRGGKKKREYNTLEFEAWDTAALTIWEKLGASCTMLVECEARSDTGTMSSDEDRIYFRVLSFKIFHTGKDFIK
jgi:hypothetical protein